MPPSELALLAFLFFAGVSGIGFAVHRFDRKARQRKLQKQGEANAERARSESELRCVECNEPVDPAHGAIFDKNAWWCEKHWKDTFQH